MTETATPPEQPDATLTPLFREAGFLAACIVGLPALIVAYVLGFHLAGDALDTGLKLKDAAVSLGVLAGLLTANPITVYLTARQYPRGKSVEAIGTADAIRVQIGRKS